MNENLESNMLEETKRLFLAERIEQRKTQLSSDLLAHYGITSKGARQKKRQEPEFQAELESLTMKDPIYLSYLNGEFTHV